MILVDAGPLIAIIDSGDSDHQACVQALVSAGLPLVTTWPAFTEAMYILGSKSGWAGQKALWSMVTRSSLEITATSAAMITRMHELMKKFKDIPMDLADASLVALAEERGTNRIFTLDSDFEVYRLPPQYKRTFVLIP